MEKNNAVLEASASLERALDYFVHEGICAVLVAAEDGRLQGVVRAKDLLRYLVLKDEARISEICQDSLSAIVDRSPPGYAAQAAVEISKLAAYEWPGVVPVLSDAGQVVGGIYCHHAIKYLHCRNRALQAEIKALLDAAHMAIIAVDREGIVTQYNRTAEKVFGLTQTEILGKHLAKLFANTRLVDVAQSRVRGDLGNKIQIGERSVLAYETAISDGDEVLGALGIYQDVSEVEKLTKELEVVKRLKAELEAIIDTSYDGLWITDGQGKVLRINRAYERIAGLSADQVVGRNMEDLVKEGLVTDSATLRVLEEKKRVTILQTSRTGKRCIVTATPVFGENGSIERVVTNTRDITELDQLRAKLERLAQSQALAKTPHGTMPVESIEIPSEHFARIVFHSECMAEVIKLVRQVSSSDTPILILGESGVGKELVARLAHELSPRRTEPFRAINCAAIPETLLESELFGYAKGAFSGASTTGKAGIIELADKGTLLLDEIGEMPIRLQAKLLRVLEEGQLMRLGSTTPIKVNCRFVAATNRDLKKMVEDGSFRADLYYRLCVVPIRVPPLRERKEDIPALVYYFLDRFNSKYGKQKEIAAEVINILRNYDWPGNVRELKNMIERLILTTETDLISANDLPVEVVAQGDLGNLQVPELMPLKVAVETVERELVRKALSKYGSTYAAARALGVSQSSIMRKVKKYFGHQVPSDVHIAH